MEQGYVAMTSLWITLLMTCRVIQGSLVVEAYQVSQESLALPALLVTQGLMAKREKQEILE